MRVNNEVVPRMKCSDGSRIRNPDKGRNRKNSALHRQRRFRLQINDFFLSWFTYPIFNPNTRYNGKTVRSSLSFSVFLVSVSSPLTFSHEKGSALAKRKLTLEAKSFSVERRTCELDARERTWLTNKKIQVYMDWSWNFLRVEREIPLGIALVLSSRRLDALQTYRSICLDVTRNNTKYSRAYNDKDERWSW